MLAEDAEELGKIAQLVSSTGAQEEKIEGKPVLPFISEKIKELNKKFDNQWMSPFGNLQGGKHPKCNVNKPVLFWAEYNNTKSKINGKTHMEGVVSGEYRRGIDGWGRTCYSYPVVINDRILTAKHGSLTCFTPR